MGKASKWFRGLLGLNKKPTDPISDNNKPPKRKWNFITQKYNHNTYTKISHPHQQEGVDSDKHAAEVAAVAAVQAAEVVGMTSSRRGVFLEAHVNGKGADYGVWKEDWAVIKIQSHFRAYLARRALRALKALVKIQALVRGYIVRKQTSDSIRRVQALLRLQARARIRRSQILEYSYSPLKNTPSRKSSRSSGKSTPADDERPAKILEIDPGRKAVPKRRNLFHSSHPSLSSDNDSHTVSTSKDSITHQAIPSPSSEVQSYGHQKLAQDLRESCYYSADHSSPQLHPVSSKGGRFSHKGPVTPTKSDGSKSCLSGCSDSPSYMSYTESSKAKIRSVSAPKQRPQQYERSSSTKRYSVHSYNDSKFNPLRVSGLQANFANKAYSGSGRLDRLGMPVGGGDGDVFCGGHWRRV